MRRFRNDHFRILFGGWRHGHTVGDICERWNDTELETDNSDDDDDDDDDTDDHDDCDSFYEVLMKTQMMSPLCHSRVVIVH